MRSRFIISESDRRSILSMYGLLVEETKIFNISGKITDNSKEKKPIQGAKIYIVFKKDNSKGGETVSDSNGDYKFDNLTLDPKYEYLVLVESDDYSSLSSKVNTKKEVQVINFSLVEKNIYNFSGKVTTEVEDDFYSVGPLKNAEVSITADTLTLVKTLTDQNGEYKLKDVKLDKNKNWGIRARATNRETKFESINLKNKEQIFNFILNGKEFKEVVIGGVPGSQKLDIATFLNFTIKSENGTPIEKMSADVYYQDKKLKPINNIESNVNGQIKNIAFLSDENKVLKKTVKNNEGIDQLVKSASDGEITVVFKKRKFSQSFKYNVKLQNKKLYWESYVAQKTEKINNKDTVSKEGKYVSLPNNGLVLDQKDLKVYLELDKTKTSDSNFVQNEIMKKGGYNKIEKLKYNQNDLLKKIDYYVSNNSEDNNLIVTLDNVLDFNLTVINKNKKVTLPNTLVKVAYDKEMTETILFERTDKQGNLNGSVELISESDESGKTFKRRKIWVEVRQPGFNVFKESLIVNQNKYNFDIELDDTEPDDPDQILDDTFTKKSNYFVFYGKTDQDYKFRAKNEDDALYFAKKDALDQYLDKSKYGRFKSYFKDKVPNGGQIVYERDDNGYYYILKFSRASLKKFVRQTIPANVLRPEIVKKENLNFTDYSVGQVLEEIKTNGKYITVFMFVSDINVQTLVNKYPKAVNELNKNSYTYRINTTKDKNYGTLSNILNTGSKQSISIVAGTSDVRMSQTIYSASDLQIVSNYIEKISD